MHLWMQKWSMFKEKRVVLSVPFTDKCNITVSINVPFLKRSAVDVHMAVFDEHKVFLLEAKTQ